MPSAPDRDRLLDPPDSVPAWVPRVDDERSVTWLRRGVIAVLVLGLLACTVRGADRPADPELRGTPGPLPGRSVPPALPGLATRVPLPGFDEIAVKVRNADGKVVGWCLLLAATEQQRERGLMEVTDLHGYPGMLFLYTSDRPAGSEGAYYMRNTPTPLSIAWFAPDGSFVSAADMAPCADIDGCPLYAPAGVYRFAIEVEQGRLAELGVGPGSTLDPEHECAPRKK